MQLQDVSFIVFWASQLSQDATLTRSLRQYVRAVDGIELQYTAFEMWWHTHRNQISSFGERTSPFKSAGASVQSTNGSRSVRISGSNAGYTMFRGSVKGTGYPLPLHFPSRASPCAITFQMESTSGLRLGCDAASLGRWCPTIRDDAVVSYSRIEIKRNFHLKGPKLPRRVQFGHFNPSIWNHHVGGQIPSQRLHIPEERKPQTRCCKSLKSDNFTSLVSEQKHSINYCVNKREALFHLLFSYRNEQNSRASAIN